jgi:hypothetical protein
MVKDLNPAIWLELHLVYGHVTVTRKLSVTCMRVLETHLLAHHTRSLVKIHAKYEQQLTRRANQLKRLWCMFVHFKAKILDGM